MAMAGEGLAPEAIPESWRAALAPVLAAPAMRQLTAWLDDETARDGAIHPPRPDWLRALALTPLDAVKVVILGQDPYHGPGQAMGLAFAVPKGCPLPPSLVNIYKELEADLGLPRASHGDLSGWAKQGVLLLNSCLTVASGMAGSHAGRGWEAVTDACLAAVAARADSSVFMLWGAHAQAKVARLAALHSGRHLVIESPHPSPLSAYRGFFGSKPFGRANAFLEAKGRAPIDWRV